MSAIRGEVVWLDAAGKVRPCVVLGEAHGRLMVVFGTRGLNVDWSKRRHVFVASESERGKALGLTADTYFESSAVRFFQPEVVAGTRVFCPPELLLELLALIGVRG